MPERSTLEKLYTEALNEYGFNVNLGWDRTKTYLTLASAVIASGVAFFDAAADRAVGCLLLVVLFLVAALIAHFGRAAARKSKSYYRRATDLKARLERELGLVRNGDSLAIAVTEGQSVKALGQAHSVSAGDQRLRDGTVLDRQDRMFLVLIYLASVGSALSAVQFVITLSRN